MWGGGGGGLSIDRIIGGGERRRRMVSILNSISVIAQNFINCYSTFVENIFNYYEGGPYSPTVHITPNSPIAKSILILQNRGFIVKRRHIKFCLNINIYSILNTNLHKEISNTQLSPKIDPQKSKSRQYKFRLI